MNKENYLKKLKELEFNKDIEMAHLYADDILCEILIELGYQDIVNAYENVEKWYS